MLLAELFYIPAFLRCSFKKYFAIYEMIVCPLLIMRNKEN